MGNKPLLSICIPTYNREAYLKEALDNILNQEGFNEEDIEIVISDNASPDRTKQLVEDYQKKYKNIKYYRNTTNIGADRNVLKSLQMGDGKYIWGVTDDDIILHGGLNIVKKNILANLDKDVWFFQTNFTSLNKDGGVIKKSFLGNKLETKIYENIDKLYKSYNYCHNGLSFFSVNIFNSKIHNLPLKNIPITWFPHSCVMGLISDKKAMFIAEDVIGYRTNNNSDNFSNIGFFFKVFVIGHLKYMKFLRKNNSLVSQKQLTKILIKMIIYSSYLWIKSIFLKLFRLIKRK